LPSRLLSMTGFANDCPVLSLGPHACEQTIATLRRTIHAGFGILASLHNATQLTEMKAQSRLTRQNLRGFGCCKHLLTSAAAEPHETNL
jgi:hypothetical protein